MLSRRNAATPRKEVAKSVGLLTRRLEETIEDVEYRAKRLKQEIVWVIRQFKGWDEWLSDMGKFAVRQQWPEWAQRALGAPRRQKV